MIKGSHQTEEAKKKIAIARIGRIASEETRKKQSESSRGRTLSQETRIKMSEARKGVNHYLFGKHHSDETKRKIGLKSKGRTWKFSGEQKQRNRELRIAEWSNPEVRNKHLESCRSDKFRGEQRLRMITNNPMSNPEVRDKHIVSLARPDVREKMKIHRLNQVFPKKDSKPEKKLQAFLTELKIKFVKHQIIPIAHKYQCDLLIPSMNTVIECDGNYFHNYPYGNEKDHIRTKELREAGYKVIRLWGEDINRMSIDEFKNLVLSVG